MSVMDQEATQFFVDESQNKPELQRYYSLLF